MAWQRFGAASPQYADVGRAMYEKWWAYTDGFIHRSIFTEFDKELLLEWMWHEIQHHKALIADRDRIIEELNMKPKKQTKGRGGRKC